MSPNDPRNPACMSTDERTDEVAAILAAGFLRWKRRTGCLPATASESAGSSKTPVDTTCHLSKESAQCPTR